MHMTFINATLGGDFSAMDIGITALATYVNTLPKHTADICDLTFHRSHWQDHLRKHLQARSPDWVGISTNTMYMKYVNQVLPVVKEISPDSRIILGGHHASINPDVCLDIPEVDAVCRGDGEYLLLDLLSRNKEPKNWRAIDGLCYDLPDDTRVSSDGHFIETIDQLPFPDWSLWEDLDKYFYYLGMIYVIGSRGCLYRCKYCDSWGIASCIKGPFYRVYPPKLYARQLYEFHRLYESRGVRLAQLFDPIFTYDEAWVHEFCASYRSLGSPLPFSAFSRIDNLTEGMIEELARANCALLRIGIEAGDENIRRGVYKKSIQQGLIKEHIRLCHQNGINVTAFYILGGPGETRETVRSTISLACELKTSRSAFFIYKPFTQDAADLVLEHGGWIDEKRWASADNITFKAVVGSPHLSARRVELFQIEAYARTLPHRLLRMLLTDKWRYFANLARYIWRGKRDGLSFMYLLTYYHIYSGDWVRR